MIIASRGKYFCLLLNDIAKTESGLFLARTLKQVPHTARVLSVGKPEIRTCGNCEDNLKPWPCKKKKDLCTKHNKPKKILAKVGDTVHFKAKGGKLLNYERKKYIVLIYNDILGVGNGK